MADSRAPALRAPPGACDSGIHIYDPAFPSLPGTRAPAWAIVAAYGEVQRRLGTSRTVIVQPTAYGTDNRCTVQAVAALGAEARGIAVIEPGVTQREVERLHEGGIRGARFQMLPGGLLPWEALEPVARRIAAFGWHVQVQMDGRLLADREALLASLPCPVVIDHVGKFLEPVPIEHPGFQALLRLIGTGRCWLKLAAAYEVSKSGPPLYADVGALAAAAVRVAPERMIWASNWPHVGVSAPQDDPILLDLLLHWATDEATRHRILVDNPANLFGFGPVAAAR
ncbi:MAG: amidohydrolase family protein [Acetobacteraceae bacterium]|nr:amidohydrolase family protein [Acetobacteraceae bacterium]